MERRVKALTSSLLVVMIAFVLLLLASRYPVAATGQAGRSENSSGISDLVQFTPAEVQELKAGQPVSKVIESDPDHEVAVAGAVWIKAPVSEYIQAMNDIEHLEHGDGFQTTKRISDPPRLEDFAALELPEVDVRDLRKCRTGECQMKLDEDAINRIQQQIDWSKPTAAADLNALLRQMALDYLTAYQRGGNKELAVYRDKKRPAYIAKEFEAMIDEMPSLQQREPALRRYLLEYPKAQLPNASSFFYWQKVNFGLKPTIRINHVVITENAGHVLVASKQIYASHYFWTALEIRELIPDPSRGQGFWFVDVSRGRSGSLAGVKGHAIHGRVRDESLKGLNEGMQATKSLLERKTH